MLLFGLVVAGWPDLRLVVVAVLRSPWPLSEILIFELMSMESRSPPTLTDGSLRKSLFSNF